MNKTLRNKILRNSTRLIECEYGNDTWNSNAYIAVKADIFSDYKLKDDYFNSRVYEVNGETVATVEINIDDEEES